MERYDDASCVLLKPKKQLGLQLVLTAFTIKGLLEYRLTIWSLPREGVVLYFHQGILALDRTHAIGFQTQGIAMERAHHAPGTALPHGLFPPSIYAILARTSRCVQVATGVDVTSRKDKGVHRGRSFPNLFFLVLHTRSDERFGCRGSSGIGLAFHSHSKVVKLGVLSQSEEENENWERKKSHFLLFNK
jgi:hypothetical protein